MHFSERAYALLVATAILAIAGVWSGDPALTLLWAWPAALLLAGLACEGFLIRRVALSADVETAARATLGREQDAAFEFRNGARRRLRIEYAPATPGGFAALTGTRFLTVPGRALARDPFTLVSVRLGTQRWPPLPVRCLGAAGLAWWARDLPVARVISVAPESARLARAAARSAYRAAVATRLGGGLGTASIACLCARRPAGAHRLEGNGAQRRTRDARIQ